MIHYNIWRWDIPLQSPFWKSGKPNFVEKDEFCLSADPRGVWDDCICEAARPFSETKHQSFDLLKSFFSSILRIVQQVAIYGYGNVIFFVSYCTCIGMYFLYGNPHIASVCYGFIWPRTLTWHTHVTGGTPDNGEQDLTIKPLTVKATIHQILNKHT